MSDFRTRKAYRTAYFINFVYKKKLIICSACSGSGYYDISVKGKTPKCSSCAGTGKVRQL